MCHSWSFFKLFFNCAEWNFCRFAHKNSEFSLWAWGLFFVFFILKKRKMLCLYFWRSSGNKNVLWSVLCKARFEHKILHFHHTSNASNLYQRWLSVLSLHPVRHKCSSEVKWPQREKSYPLFWNVCRPTASVCVPLSHTVLKEGTKRDTVKSFWELKDKSSTVLHE